MSMRLRRRATPRGVRLAQMLESLAAGRPMPSLAARTWSLKYNRDEGDLVRDFYVPALECAVSYDRSTGYFNAHALNLAMRGIEGLVRNNGRMRLIVGCTLEQHTIDAITRGVSLRDAVDQHLAARPLEPPTELAKQALELLAWMIQHGFLEVKVAIPCDSSRAPTSAEGIFHEKAGIIQDAEGNRLAFIGSINETAAGWTKNWESFAVFPSWTGTAEYAAREAADFARIWADQAKHVITLDVPTAAKADLMRFMPETDVPARLRDKEPPKTAPEPEPQEPPVALPPLDIRRQVWDYIERAPTFAAGGALVGEATCAVKPWPHQVRAFERLYATDAPRLLIADEVGLGKTIQAGMLLRQMWLAKRARRILILTPAAVMRQWQLELREKFNLNWPIYDDGCLHWYPSPGAQVRLKAVARADWHKENVVIASSHLMRRREREKELCEDAEPWDLVVLDEAHHARRKGAGSDAEEGPNALLRLMHRLRSRTKGLVLLTATPMQVHPVEVWDLLDLLGMPAAWGEGAFLRFFELVGKPAPSASEFDELAGMFRAAERAYGETTTATMTRLGVASKLKAKQILGALRDESGIPRRQLDADSRASALKLMRSTTPVSQLVSRHTRDLLRRYFKAGKITTPIADRSVHDEFIDMSPAERAAYEAVEDYISTTYNQASPNAKNAVGFVMTVYRRRLASSFRALAQTLENRLVPLQHAESAADDAEDDESKDDVMDADEAARLEQEALKTEEKGDIEALLRRVSTLPVDTKALKLVEVLRNLRKNGYAQTMVFTQFTDTMDFLRKYLATQDLGTILCFSGRGGEELTTDGRWRPITRDEVKRRFREGRADLLLCTDAAAEGLNFQFCGSLVNYEMPWNPMRVEQRIGRIDRLGQKYATIRVINLHYSHTVETDVYMALRNRIQLFESVVGRLQPILSQMSRTIAQIVLQRGASSDQTRANVASDIIARVDAIKHDDSGLDIDLLTDEAMKMPARPLAPLNLDMLDAVIRHNDLMPSGITTREFRPREYAYQAPGMQAELRVTTDAEYFEEHPENLELWSPGSPVFPAVPDPPRKDQEVTITTNVVHSGEDGRLDVVLAELQRRTLRRKDPYPPG
jgi:SNF2 family DNA or RNA helicase